MKEEGTIKAERRTHASSGTNKRLRREGYLPGNIFGKDMEPIPVLVKKDELNKNLAKYGRNSVYKIDLAGEKAYTVMIREIQHLAVMGGDLHVDFQKIVLSEETKAAIPVKVVGGGAIEAQKLVLLHQMDTITVKGLPRSMPDYIEVDVSALGAGDNITIGSIEFPKGITCDVDPDHVVVTVVEPRQKETEEVEETAEVESEAVAEE
ncbi:MAG: 50S ribosomal protein L25 [Firmicutes bacterium HGW-Firmicutes-11]|jgi:large subunit ribosomal protein L25|nr:MAG: 50S ribosomal protein L25 [Firmicutes bacterium HGW-Firmicutes-11]